MIPRRIFGVLRYRGRGLEISGPGTGDHHRRLVAELEGLIEELLAEPA